MTTPPVLSCPLCRLPSSDAPVRAHGRKYRECRGCGLVFMHPDGRPTPVEERARYDTHENDPGDPRYRAFLSRLAAPLMERLSPGAVGLDYGSGPGPTLSVMLTEAGFPTENYDPFFAPDTEALERTYDFLTCSETAEHFFQPAREFQTFDRLLRPGGWLGVMTERPPRDVALADWHYARDPTHVCFYRRRTMEWIASEHGWAPEFPHRNVVLFRNGRPGDR